MTKYLEIILIAGGVAAIGAVGFTIYKAGAEREKLKVERQNTEASGRANEAAMSWRDCTDRHGVYHFDTGKCVGATSVDR